MVERGLRLTSLDNNHIVLDIGLTYTKCGFAQSSMPMHIVPTPFKAITKLRENIKELKSTSFANAFPSERELTLEIEEFLHYVFYHLLQISPKDKAVVLCESIMGLRCLTETISHCLFNNFGIKSIYFMLSNVLPMYTTGVDTGIIVDCGF
mmetsp:Transcript_31374/g.22736  ORF Transcript_31374/g.22736 Transcript_31374/m.22736 type:complete len:151 (+) Transcript_31374:10-462(+)